MTAHQDVAGVVAQLRQPNFKYTAATGGDPDMSHYIRWLLQRCDNAATLIESLSRALSEAKAERDYQTGFIQKLQTALAFWMPGVDLRLDEATRELAADDAYLLAGSTGERDLPCWGEGILERALTAESRLAEAMRLLDDLSSFQISDALNKTGKFADVCKAWIERKNPARRFLNAGKE